MTDLRTVEEYDRRLVDFAKRWEEKFPAEAAELRAELRIEMRIPDNAQSPITLLALEQRFRDEVAKRNNKPSLKDFLRGAA